MSVSGCFCEGYHKGEGIALLSHKQTSSEYIKEKLNTVKSVPTITQCLDESLAVAIYSEPGVLKPEPINSLQSRIYLWVIHICVQAEDKWHLWEPQSI